jgi:hypothetical protein
VEVVDGKRSAPPSIRSRNGRITRAVELFGASGFAAPLSLTLLLPTSSSLTGTRATPRRRRELTRSQLFRSGEASCSFLSSATRKLTLLPSLYTGPPSDEMGRVGVRKKKLCSIK